MTFSQAKDPMEAKHWLKSIEKKLEIAQCTDQEKVLFIAHQLFGTAANWWEMYRNLTQMLVLSRGISSKLDLELTAHLVIHSS
jgi:hypothetical protein